MNSTEQDEIKREECQDPSEDYYTQLKDRVAKYLRFGTKGNYSVWDVKKKYFTIQIPDDLNVLQVPNIEASLARLHATASFELSMAECSLSLAEEMYEMAFNTEMENVKAKYLGQREPGAEKLRAMVLKGLDERLTFQKLYAANAVSMMKKVLSHLDYVASRLKNVVEACKVDARLERGAL